MCLFYCIIGVLSLAMFESSPIVALIIAAIGLIALVNVPSDGTSSGSGTHSGYSGGSSSGGSSYGGSSYSSTSHSDLDAQRARIQERRERERREKRRAEADARYKARQEARNAERERMRTLPSRLEKNGINMARNPKSGSSRSSSSRSRSSFGGGRSRGGGGGRSF